MTSSLQMSMQSEIQNAENLSEETLSYFRARLKNRLHAEFLKKFSEQNEQANFTKADLARRTNKKPEQISRIFGAPGNWTLDTVSDLFLALGCEPDASISYVFDREESSAMHQTIITQGVPLNKEETDRSFKYLNADPRGTTSAKNVSPQENVLQLDEYRVTKDDTKEIRFAN